MGNVLHGPEVPVTLPPTCYANLRIGWASDHLELVVTIRGFYGLIMLFWRPTMNVSRRST
jgi:hypothetical protein